MLLRVVISSPASQAFEFEQPYPQVDDPESQIDRFQAAFSFDEPPCLVIDHVEPSVFEDTCLLRGLALHRFNILRLC
jgi:hypothetical protein